jgi:succinate dehydrogenase/fumarate reductase flavoprotein subunit
MNDGRFSVDLLVIGGGMTGLTAAAFAARRGLEVLLVEKAPEVGGSAAMSSGYMWTAPRLEDLQWEDPACDPELGTALADHFLEGIDWVRGLGVQTTDKITGIYGFGHGYQTDIGLYLDRCRSALEASAGWISTGVQVQELNRDGDRITGARALDRDGAEVEIEAKWTLLATGGFQGDPALRQRFIGPEGERLVLRANPYSTGDGLKLATAVGAVPTPGEGFYGHLIPTPLDSFEPKDYLNFAQLHSGHCLLVNKDGVRFTDETLGDHINTQELLAQPGSTGAIIGDEHVRETHVLSAYIKGMDVFDKLVFAGEAGANYAVADTIADLASKMADWGYPADAVAQTVNDFNERVASDASSLQPPNERHTRVLDTPPYFALEVQPAITFPYAGLTTNADAEVLGENGPIAGLLAGGVDVGGVYKRGYAGALARGLVFGIRAALTAAGEPSWREVATVEND